MFYPNSNDATFFGKLVATAIDLDTFPLLIVSHLSEEAIEKCEQVGILAVVLERQIFPNSTTKRKREVLEKTFGPEPYERIERGRPLHHKVSEQTKRSIAQLGDELLFYKRYATWMQAKSKLLPFRKNSVG